MIMLSGSLYGLVGCGVQTGKEPPCEYDPPRCEVNTLLFCDAEGRPASEDCGEARCAADAPLPQCVDPLLLPCDPRRTEPTCQNGLLRQCDAASGYPATVDCGAGKLCHEGACARLDALDCDVERWAPLCVGGRAIGCEMGQLVEATGC